MSDLEKKVRTLRRRSIFTLFLTWLALFFTVIGIAAGYKNFLRVHDKAKLAQSDAKLAAELMPDMASKVSVERWQDEIRTQLIKNKTQTSMELAELKSLKNSNAYIESTLRQQAEQMTRQQQIANHQLDKSQQHSTEVQSDQHWQIAEVRYLLKIASHHLRLNNDPVTAIAALKAADRELLSLALPNLLPLRRLVAKDIARLQSYQSVDLSAVIGAIDELANRLKQKLAAKQIVRAGSGSSTLKSDTAVLATGANDSAATDDSIEKPDTLLKRMKARLDETVVIKRYDNKLAKKIKGDTQQVRFELIRLKLETLKLLALKSQPQAYQKQLNQLSALLTEEHNELLDDSIETALVKLKTLEIKAELPNLLARQYLDELLVTLSEDQP